ncbi:hypothetical protein EDC02_5785 [Micromonospora sp. Llam0]|nr:hypothetical protein EDC02_5785 [Micromonospora sp. Llam0]
MAAPPPPSAAEQSFRLGRCRSVALPVVAPLRHRCHAAERMPGDGRTDHRHCYRRVQRGNGRVRRGNGPVRRSYGLCVRVRRPVEPVKILVSSSSRRRGNRRHSSNRRHSGGRHSGHRRLRQHDGGPAAPTLARHDHADRVASTGRRPATEQPGAGGPTSPPPPPSTAPMRRGVQTSGPAAANGGRSRRPERPPHHQQHRQTGRDQRNSQHCHVVVTNRATSRKRRPGVDRAGPGPGRQRRTEGNRTPSAPDRRSRRR